MAALEVIPCPQDGCDRKGSKTAIRKHLVNDHGMTWYKAKELLPFEAQNKYIRQVHQRITELEQHVNAGADMTAQLADVTSKLYQSNNYVKQLEGQLAEARKTQVPGTTTEADRLAVLEDWISGLTKEAWVKIGEERRFFDESPEPDQEPAAVAAMADAALVPAAAEPRTVFVPGIGISVRVKEK